MKDQLFKWIDDSIDIAIELQTELTKRPAISPESGGTGELDKCLFLEEFLKANGITNLERYNAPDIRAKGQERPNLVATIDGSDGNKERLWIMSHIDIVPPGDEELWESDPWTVVKKEDKQGIKLIGRGVEDNQQGIVSSILAALAFVKQGLKPERTIKLLFVSDEEVGSVYGIKWLVENHSDLFKKSDMVLVPDGGDIKGEFIEIAEKNVLWIKFTTNGRQAHSARPDSGVNAFLAGCELALCLHYELSAEFYERDSLFNPDYSTFQVTKKEANVQNINTIPGQDIFYMDMRILPMYSTELVLKEVDNIKTIIEEKHGVTIEYSIEQRMESIPTPVDSLIVKKIGEAAKEIYNVEAKPLGIGGGTVAAHLRKIGIDCAVWTKTQQSLHQPNEYCYLDNIIGDAKVMALLVK